MNEVSGNASRDRPTALIIDDSAVARRALGALLLRLGFRVETATSGEAGLTMLEDHVPSVVFVDHLLPEIDGLSAVRLIRSNPLSKRVPIVMYTSMETRKFARSARQAGADDVLFKSGGGASLEVILARLGLGPDVPREEPVPTNLPAALAAALRRHKEDMREELLAEFAILERYEETMRKELFLRVDAMTRKTVRAVEEQFHQRRVASELSERARRRRGWAVSVCLAVLFGASAWANVAMWQQVKALGDGGPVPATAPAAAGSPDGKAPEPAQRGRIAKAGDEPVVTAGIVPTSYRARPDED